MTKKHEHAVVNTMTAALSSNQILSETSSQSSAGAADGEVPPPKWQRKSRLIWITNEHF